MKKKIVKKLSSREKFLIRAAQIEIAMSKNLKEKPSSLSLEILKKHNIKP